MVTNQNVEKKRGQNGRTGHTERGIQIKMKRMF